MKDTENRDPNAQEQIRMECYFKNGFIAGPLSTCVRMIVSSRPVGAVGVQPQSCEASSQIVK